MQGMYSGVHLSSDESIARAVRLLQQASYVATIHNIHS